ncbi:MAG: hypothetical protein BECKG1743D_GA0114223_100634 [Candidatus Kentron sp. G]|nr:MAG: hypothetical protein BECKG1743F_GA0114225_100504 [Candidatus Kentron sp. G]VFM96274.1 MAG: hypothetical protein BECKG1743E_GA0114224_100464 [Candidatus Kentron sp. G]VFM98438.1 MAG: hypothetical protein BECKG1743D_GA0114223_100634 [Candidatus Kentron sp. G]
MTNIIHGKRTFQYNSRYWKSYGVSRIRLIRRAQQSTSDKA